MQEPDISNLFRSIRLIIVGSGVCCGVLAFAVQPGFADRMDEWRLLPRPERVTQLYFNDYSRLSAPDGHSPDRTVTFTVRNLEHRTTDYRYTISAAPEDGKGGYLLDNGSFSLRHDHSLTTNKAVTLPPLDRPVALKVSLEYEGIAFGDDVPSVQTQSIYYWISAAGLSDDAGRGV